MIFQDQGHADQWLNKRQQNKHLCWRGERQNVCQPAAVKIVCTFYARAGALFDQIGVTGAIVWVAGASSDPFIGFFHEPASAVATTGALFSLPVISNSADGGCERRNKNTITEWVSERVALPPRWIVSERALEHAHTDHNEPMSNLIFSVHIACGSVGACDRSS